MSSPINLDAIPKKCTTYKFMLEIQLYPDGKAFPKLYPVGKDTRELAKKPVIKEKQIAKSNSAEVESL